MLMVEIEAYDAAGVLLAAQREAVIKSAVLPLKNRFDSCYEFTCACTYNCEIMYGTPKWDGDVERELTPLYPLRREISRDESESKPLPAMTKWNFSKAIAKHKSGT